MEQEQSRGPERSNPAGQSEVKRLNKYIGETGFCSRREADMLIEEGRVVVNGEPAVMGMKVSNEDEVRIDGKLIREKNEKPVYLAFNKPPGIECTTNPDVKDNIVDFINYPKRIFPIGRLDKASEGLIFMTNDGDIVNKILRARNNHEKEYTVTVDKPITSRFIDRMGNGVPILDTVTRKCKVEQLSKYTFKIILTQGLNRQIRRMCEYLGYEVTKLIRIRIINITLDLPAGRYRELTDTEIAELNQLIEPSSKTEEASLEKVERRMPDVERKPYGKREENTENPTGQTQRRDYQKPASIKRNVEFVKKEDTKSMRDTEDTTAENPKRRYVKKADAKTTGEAKPREEVPKREQPKDDNKTAGAKRWKVEFISKDDPEYKKREDL